MMYIKCLSCVCLKLLLLFFLCFMIYLVFVKCKNLVFDFVVVLEIFIEFGEEYFCYGRDFFK